MLIGGCPWMFQLPNQVLTRKTVHQAQCTVKTTGTCSVEGVITHILSATSTIIPHLGNIWRDFCVWGLSCQHQALVWGQRPWSSKRCDWPNFHNHSAGGGFQVDNRNADRHRNHCLYPRINTQQNTISWNDCGYQSHFFILNSPSRLLDLPMTPCMCIIKSIFPHISQVCAGLILVRKCVKFYTGKHKFVQSDSLGFHKFFLDYFS